MLLLCLIIIPALSGIISFFVKQSSWRKFILVFTAIIHTGLTLDLWWFLPSSFYGGWLILDNLGLFFLSITSVLFLCISIYAVGYFKQETTDKIKDFEEDAFFTNAPEARFKGCLLLFLSAMSLVCVSGHFGLQWVAVEATTLASAPLIYYHRHHRSLEANWKYLLICSVGIALALMGNFFLVVAGGEVLPLYMRTMIENAAQISTPWLKASFIFFLVGYGTKMGLAPLHTWLPDAHSEAPSLVSALLSGTLLNCSFLAILRVWQVCIASGNGAFCQELFLVFGLLSMAVATVFILGQKDYKRMLAYSSVEHMGILILGMGIGGAAIFGSMLHILNHSLTKAMLFLLSGNILRAYKTKSCDRVCGILRVLPVSGMLWMAGFFAIVGFPPFSIFLSEFTILKAALDGGMIAVSVIFLVLLVIIFIGMSKPFLGMAQGDAPEGMEEKTENFLCLLPPIVLIIFIIIGGVYIPPVLSSLLHNIARTLGGG
ncbi:MAG: proton-conducting transporter membrane subunit [Nitrospirota bacterium]